MISDMNAPVANTVNRILLIELGIVSDRLVDDQCFRTTAYLDFFFCIIVFEP